MKKNLKHGIICVYIGSISEDTIKKYIESQGKNE